MRQWTSTSAQLEIANKAYARKGHPFLPEYISTLKVSGESSMDSCWQTDISPSLPPTEKVVMEYSAKGRFVMICHFHGNMDRSEEGPVAFSH